MLKLYKDKVGTFFRHKEQDSRIQNDSPNTKIVGKFIFTQGFNFHEQLTQFLGYTRYYCSQQRIVMAKERLNCETHI